MSLMKKQPAVTQAEQQIAQINWPDMVWPDSSSPIKGMTPEEQAAFNVWYLGVKNSINNQFSQFHTQVQGSIQTLNSTISTIQGQVTTLQSKTVATAKTT